VSAGKRFGRYKTEKERAVRKSDVKEDKTLRQLKDAWRNFVWGKPYSSMDTYSYILSDIEGINCSSEDVERFNLALAEFQDEDRFPLKAGLFLSALINTGKDAEYRLHTEHIERRIESLGFMNTKKLVILGPAGSSVGHSMRSGEILVKGDAAERAGDAMRGGKLEIEGNAGRNPGWIMGAGTILVRGNAGRMAGHGMNGGKLEILGDVEGFPGCECSGGTVLIWGNGGDKDMVSSCGATVIVMGNAKRVGGIQTGRIEVYGDVDGEVGRGMKDGEIMVHGGVSGDVGIAMSGGKIRIRGTVHGSVAEGTPGIEIEGRSSDDKEIHLDEMHEEVRQSEHLRQWIAGIGDGSVYDKGKLFYHTGVFLDELPWLGRLLYRLKVWKEKKTVKTH
jgi:formylmethanofuran dehydrogenase subunit C